MNEIIIITMIIIMVIVITTIIIIIIIMTTYIALISSHDQSAFNTKIKNKSSIKFAYVH